MAYPRLIALRKDHGLTQQQIADYLGIHQTTYSNYEIGRLNLPTYHLVQLALFFHTSTDYILEIDKYKKDCK